MDRITRSYLNEFRDEQTLAESMPESELFELFAIQCVVSGVHDDEFDCSELSTGGGSDLGIDGIAIIVNGSIVNSPDEAEDLLEINGFLDVKFIFVQAKTSSGFDGQEISTFLDGALEFFAEDLTLPANEAIENARLIMTWIYANSVKFTRQKPIVQLHYVTTGKWVDDRYLNAKIDARKKRIQETELFENVIFRPYGATEAQTAYQRSKNNITVEFNFPNKVTLPEIENITVAYLGYLSSGEYLKLLTDPLGNIRKPLFYDNVRDYQGENPVNLEIQNTLGEPAGRQQFALLNNGVTIVTRELRTTGNKFAISDYQIVNGCQTSHVLFDARDHLGEDTNIPIKVIATDDEEIISSIITSTNRQTEVTMEDLFAKSAFQKSLESFFNSFPPKKKLYYERRSRQYSTVSGIEKVRIIDKKIQLRAFAAMFLDDAHRAARYYSDLRTQVPNGKIFNDTHKLEPYYTAAYSYYKLEFFFRNNQIPVKYKVARYHILMTVRHLIGDGDAPAINSNKMSAYSNKISEELWVDQKALDAFKAAVEVIDSAVGSSRLTRDTVKTQSFTDSVKAAAKAKAIVLANERAEGAKS